MYKILDRYIIKFVLLKILLIFLILISLSSTIKLFDELRNFEKKNNFIFEVFFYIILNLPKEFDLFLPISTLLGGLLGFSILETHNELIIMQISGFSKKQITIPIIVTSILVMLINITSNEWLLPFSQKLVSTYPGHKQYNNYLFPEKNKNLWLIENNNFIYIEKMSTTTNLSGINLFYFTKNKKLHKILYIKQAKYINQHWSLFNITELNFSQKTCITKKTIPFIEWNTILTPKLLSMIIINPRFLSISNLTHCIKYLNKVGQNAKYYQLIFWNKIISPITGVMMIIIALLFSWGPFYKKKTNIKLFFGSIIGFLFYMLHQIIGIISITYNISPIIGALGPIILFSIINMIILWKYS